MTNTKFRKRALLSSVAMLLVALVALGSATFAWFSTTNSATASSIVAKTSKASNILLSETGNSGWTNSLTFAGGTSQTGTTALTPVTTKDYTNWYSVEANNYNQGYSTTSYGTAIDNIEEASTYVKYTTLFIKSQGADKDITISAAITDTDTANSTGTKYVRVALVPLATASTNATATFASGSAGASALTFGQGGTSSNDRSNETAGWNAANQTSSANTIVDAAFGSSGATVLGKATAEQVYGFAVYVYYEGTDFDCKDDQSGTDISVSFTVTGADPA